MRQNVVTLYGELLGIPDEVEKEPSNDHCGISLPGPEGVAGNEDAVVVEQDTRVNKDKGEMANDQPGLVLPEETEQKLPDVQLEKMPDGQPLTAIDTAVRSAVDTTDPSLTAADVEGPEENDHSGTELGGNQAVNAKEASPTEMIEKKTVPPPSTVQKPVVTESVIATPPKG